MRLRYLGDQERAYPRFIDVGGDDPKTLEAVPGETYDVIASSGHPVPVPTDGLWEGADDDAKAALTEAFRPAPNQAAEAAPPVETPPPPPAPEPVTTKPSLPTLNTPKGA